MKIMMTLANQFTHDPRVYNEAKSLIKAGHEVTVLAWDKKGKNIAHETKDNINIIRSYNSNFMNILPYDILRLHWWWIKGYSDAEKIFKKTNFDVVHCHDLSSLPIGVKLKKKFGIKLIYDAHEIWGYMVAKDLPMIWAKYYISLEKRLMKYCNEIILAEDQYVNYFQHITNKSFTIILNCKHLFLESYKESKNKIVKFIYIGTLSPPRFLIELVDVIKKIDNVQCFIGGKVNKSYAKQLIEEIQKANNVEFIGLVPIKKVIPLTLESDVVVCMIDPSNYNNKIATANKQFEAMVCGRPIICTKGTRSGEITQEEKCGLLVDYSKKDLHEAIIKLRDDSQLREKLGKNALISSKKKYNWKHQEKNLLNLYNGILED